MPAVWYCIRAEFRARLWARVALVALIAFIGGVVLTTAAGARRTSSAFGRLISETNAADVLVNPDRGIESGLDAEAVARVPGVAATGHAAGMFFSDDRALLPLASADGRFGYSVERPNLLHGRMPEPDRRNEVLVDPTMARNYHLKVGSALELRSGRPGELQKWDGADGRPDDGKGPGAPPVQREHFTVAGIGVFSNRIVQDERFAVPSMFLTPAYYRTHPDHELYLGVFSQLKGGRAAVPAFKRAVETLPHEGLFEYQTLAVTEAKVQRAVRPQAVALGLFALVVAATGLFVIGQALNRQLFTEAVGHAPLASVGFSRSELFGLAMGPFAATALAGTVLAVGLAIAASPLMPVGPARDAEPHRGISVDLVALVGGAATLLVLVLGVAALVAWRLSRQPDRRPFAHEPTRGVSRLAATLVGAGAPPTAVTGVRLALEPGRGPTAVPTRSSLLGAGVAVAAVAAALTFAASLQHLVTTPRLFGWNWDIGVEVFPDDSSKIPALRNGLKARLDEEPGVAGWATTAVSRLSLNGENVPAVGFEPGRGDVAPTITSGHAPRDGEIALGRRTLARLHVAEGDIVTARLGNTTRGLRVVGRTVLPGLGTYEGSDKTELGEGAVVSITDLQRVAPDFGHYLYLVDADRGVAPRALGTRIVRGFSGNDVRYSGVQRPAEIANYRRLRTTPLILAGVLAALATATVTHALVAAVRRRRRDFAILKTLGFARRQVSTTVAWQASTVLGLALLVGLPLGVAAGRWAWTLVARQLGVAAEPITPLLAVLLAAPAGLALANVAAAFPARVASRLRPATVLRRD